MSTFRLRTAIALLLPVAIALPTYAEDREAKFEGYSPVAKLMVEKLLQSVRQVSTYSDEAVIKTVTGLPFGAEEQPASFTFVKPRSFCVKTDAYEIHSDGKELAVYAKRLRRYTRAPVDKDIVKQIKRYAQTTGLQLSLGELFLSRDSGKQFAKHFRDLDLAGRDAVDGDRCYVLSGTTKTSAMGTGEAEVPVSLWLRESDSLIRRIELDLLEAMKERFDEDDGMFMPFKEYKLVYDVRDLQINEPIPQQDIAFKPPSGAKKVDRLYTVDRDAAETATQFELSGQRAPDFELETTDGRWVTRASLEGNVVLLDFQSPWRFSWRGRDVQRFERLDEIRRDYADRKVTVLCVSPQATADKFVDELREAGLDLGVAVDPNRTVTSQYFDDVFASGIVLLDPDGIVQGCYRGRLADQAGQALRSDIDKLLSGEPLSGAKPMSDEQIAEARDQRAASVFGGGSVDPINEDHLQQAWSIRARGSRSFAFGAGSNVFVGGDLWVRDKNVVRRISPDGRVSAEVRLASPSWDMLGRDVFVAGRLGARWGVVYMAPIPGDQEFMGFRPPKGATLTASDEAGEQLWELELEVTNQQLPQHVTLADIDGRTGDELLFVHAGAIWVVDGRGDVIVRKPCTGSPQWLLVDDRDRDGRAEVYLRTEHKLQRFDYHPN